MKLNIISTDNTPPSQKKTSTRDAAQARFDREWLQYPEQFNPLRNSMEQQRLDDTMALITSHVDLQGKHAVDLGCGAGTFSRRLRDAGAIVTAVDISANALKAFSPSDNITIHRDYVPRTLLDDSSFDIVVALDLIAYLDAQDYRLFFAELARLVKHDGYVICSTPIDINSDNALQRFASLATTELQIIAWSFRHNTLLIRLRNLFRTLHIPIPHFLNHNPHIMHSFARLSTSLCANHGISHALFIATRKPLVTPSAEASHPIERKHKRQVWE